jgi:ABC-type antimicrobial peptide transport system permease subunit
MRLALAGMALGTLLALAVGRLISSLLFATSSWDLPTYLGTALALLLVAATAGYIPARRASGVNPMEVLRSN